MIYSLESTVRQCWLNISSISINAKCKCNIWVKCLRIERFPTMIVQGVLPHVCRDWLTSVILRLKSRCTFHALEPLDHDKPQWVTAGGNNSHCVRTVPCAWATVSVECENCSLPRGGVMAAVGGEGGVEQWWFLMIKTRGNVHIRQCNPIAIKSCPVWALWMIRSETFLSSHTLLRSERASRSPASCPFDLRNTQRGEAKGTRGRGETETVAVSW